MVRRSGEGSPFEPAWGTKTYIMGIVNVTPDSFSGDGLVDPKEAVDHGILLAANGADILDVGGESSRPGADPVGVEEELRRVIPVIEGLRARVDLPISVDTRRAAVAAAAIRAGASIVNDVWGFRTDADLPQVVAESGAWAVTVHNRHAKAATLPGLGGFFPEVDYSEVMDEVIQELRGSIAVLAEAGVPQERIIVDPGIGFGKTPDMSGPLLKPGAFFALEAGGWHYAWTGDEEGIVQVTEPGGIMYANPADDPRMKMK